MSNTTWDKIVSDKALAEARALRSRTFVVKKDWKIALSELEREGWTSFKTYADSRYIGVRKEKAFDEQFEDKVWMLFAKMGFTYMNSDRNFQMSYDYQNPNFTQQIDVFAADEESIIIVECKSSEKPREVQFKKQIEAFHGQMDGLLKEAKRQFPGRKVKFIWATQNCIISKADLLKLQEWGIIYFNDTIINYYTELVKHLGVSAKYQLLGNLFANTEINNMEDKIPAIQGKMGGFTYYSFSIEPERLLKIGYVLHRNEANKNMMPTYQRLIKKKRLQDVQAFVNNGGYFPNSIIISIDTNGKGLPFDLSPTKVDGCISRLGILHLPKRYRSAYIIDGQHRLYGYSGSPFASKNSIPVVAFIDLNREEQIKLFMEINEHQKAVPKTLRVTLNADMLWNSSDYNEQRQAIRSKIAQMLGEENTSPLWSRVVIGEDEKTSTKNITVEAIQGALKKCDFLTTFGKKNIIQRDGSFDLNENQATCDRLYNFLEIIFKYVKDNATEEWERLDSNITMNRGIQAIIRVTNDIVNLLIQRREIHSKTDSLDLIAKKVEFYLDPLLDYLNNLSSEERKSLRDYFGGNADRRFWRTYQKAISEIRTDFKPEGFVEYWENEAKTYNQESALYISEIKNTVKAIFVDTLQNHYGTKWMIQALPKPVYTKAKQQADDHNYELARSNLAYDAEEVSLWDYISLSDLKQISVSGNHWTSLFEPILTRPEEVKLSGGKEAKTEWLTKIETIERKMQNQNYSVSAQDFELIKSIHAWLCSPKI